MLDLDTRTAVLRLHAEGHGSRKIARALRVSRNTVRKVIQSREATVPPMLRNAGLDHDIDRVRELHTACEGNLIRVHEELAAQGVDIGYSTLTRFCRRHEIGTRPKKRSGTYHFEPGQEMQHDTSPHTVKVGGRMQALQCASVVLCYSRMRYIQCFPRWNRFLVKVFLTDAIRYFGGAAEQCMLDNASVVVLRGTGKDAVMAPEMEAFADRFGFTFVAHEKGDANRSGRVERPFHHFEHNFYPGRTFDDLDDLNAQAVAWCDKFNGTWNRWLHASPRELFAAERAALKPLPLHVPEVYDLHHRRVDTEGYINLHVNRYSMPAGFIGRQVTVHEHRDRLRIFDGHRLIQEHTLQPFRARKKVTLPDHRFRRGKKVHPPLPEEGALRAAGPELSTLVDALRKRHGGRAAKAVKRLHHIYLDYPTEAVCSAVATALDYGLLDLERIERIVLRRVAGDFFRLPTHTSEEEDDG